MASGQHMRFQPMKSNAMSHNHRLKVPSYVVSEKTELNVVYVQTSKRNLTDYTKAVKADYENHHGQKYQDKMNPLWETLIVVNPETKDEQIREAIKLIERETGLKIVDAVRHKDEGHFKGDEWIPNEHVHLIAERYNFETHKHVTLDVKQIRELRLKVANTLGIAYTQTKEGEKPKKNVSHHKFREEAQKGQIVAQEYSLKEMQARIIALENANADLRKELHAENRAINKTKDLEEKERKITELETKISKLQEAHNDKEERNAELFKIKDIKAQGLQEKIVSLEAKLTEAVKVPHEPINASKIAGLQSEIEMLQINNRVLERELKETKSAPVPKGENEASRSVEAQIEAVHLPEIKPKTTELDIRQIEHRADEKEAKFGRGKHYVAELMEKHTTWKGFNKEAFAEEMGGELKETATILSRAQEAIRDLSRYGDKAKSYLKTTVESSKKGLEAIFSKITGKSLPQVKNERTEQERAIQQEKIRQAEAQKAKEPEQVKAPSRGLSLGR